MCVCVCGFSFLLKIVHGSQIKTAINCFFFIQGNRESVQSSGSVCIDRERVPIIDEGYAPAPSMVQSAWACQ